MVALPADMVLCGDTALSLTVDTATLGATITWSNASNFNPVLYTGDTILISPALSGVYYVKATDAIGCTATDSIQVTNAPAAITANPAVLKLCQGNTEELGITSLNPNDILTYAWSNGLPAIPNPSVGPSSDASYTVTVTNQYGCTATTDIDVHVITVAVTAEVTGLDTVCTGQTTTLLATPSGNADTYLYSWDPSGSLTGANTADPVATPNGVVTYTVTVLADSICPAYASVTVYFREIECRAPYIFVPKAFTPNGDGHNDRFRVRGTDIRLLYFVVYDRWGEEVYKTEDPDDLGWDGTFRGEPSHPDSYGWYLRVTCGNGAIFEDKGDVTLLK